MKHTQGEWYYSKHGNNDSFGVYADGMPNDLAIVKGGNEDGGETEANAKLMACAPELRDVLQMFVDYLDSDLSEAEQILKRKAEYIISKATL